MVVVVVVVLGGVRCSGIEGRYSGGISGSYDVGRGGSSGCVGGVRCSST